jgi:hypothetical protein
VGEGRGRGAGEGKGGEGWGRLQWKNRGTLIELFCKYRDVISGCVGDHIGAEVLHSVSDHIWNLQNC